MVSTTRAPASARRRRQAGAALGAVALAGSVLSVLPSAAGAAAVGGTNILYTTDADFDSGALADVNHDAPNSDQLQLNSSTAHFPYVNVAASARGTMVRIDVNTGAIVGEWRSAPDGRGKDPSRTTVDKFGNTWLSNRAESAGGKGSVTRIGVIQGGTRVDADGTPNPTGDHLKAPFAYNTCVDRNGDGLIATSRGLGDIRPWSNAAGADDNGGVSTAADECVINYTRVTGANTRTVAVDGDNDVWVGGLDRDHELLDGDSGAPVPGTQINRGCGGYGGLVDQAGTLWSALSGGQLLRYVPGTGAHACLDASHGDYGLGMDPNTGEIWQTNFSGNRVVKLAPDGTILGAFAHSNDGQTNAQGVAVDLDGNVWVAHSLAGGTTVGHLRTDGTLIGNVALPGGNGPTGVAVDKNGKVWVTNINTNNAMRIDPNAGPVGLDGVTPVGAVDLTVDLGAGAGPYNYSDMTGSVLGEITAPQGTWSVVQDGGAAGTNWGTVTWNTEAQGSEPAGTSIAFEARTADVEADLAAQAWTAVGNGVAFSLTGRYIEVRGTLKANPSGESPVLSDVRIETGNAAPLCDEATASVEQIWPPNHTFVPVTVNGVTDSDGDTVTVTVTGIRQDEVVNGPGDGSTAPDGRGVGTSVAEVRAERAGGGDGRVYHVAFTAADGNGGGCSGAVRVSVPHDRRGAPAVDGGPLHDSTLS